MLTHGQRLDVWLACISSEGRLHVASTLVKSAAQAFAEPGTDASLEDLANFITLPGSDGGLQLLASHRRVMMKLCCSGACWMDIRMQVVNWTTQQIGAFYIVPSKPRHLGVAINGCPPPRLSCSLNHRVW